jgi:hypothetical protein
MLATQSVLFVAFIVVGLTAWWLLRKRNWSSGQSAFVVGVALWATASAVIWWNSTQAPASSVEFRGRSQLVQSLDSIAWPETSKTPAAVAPPEAALQAAPVESLVDGLEARLAAQPNDANGWALLAQSYAYTSDEENAERAVQRAVALGFDERALRERVASAERRAPAGDWFDRVMPTKRP